MLALLSCPSYITGNIVIFDLTVESQGVDQQSRGNCLSSLGVHHHVEKVVGHRVIAFGVCGRLGSCSRQPGAIHLGKAHSVNSGN